MKSTPEVQGVKLALSVCHPPAPGTPSPEVTGLRAELQAPEPSSVSLSGTHLLLENPIPQD